MDMIKIGEFIALKRKKQNLTQIELAEKLNITDRAISKWERGKSMPDSSIMLDLCKILKISVNELLTGEELEMINYNKQAELNLIEMKKQKEDSDKRLLATEIMIGVTTTIIYFVLLGLGIYLANVHQELLWLAIILLSFGTIQFLAIICVCVKIEQKAGYYECKECHHKYVPSFNQVFFAMHINRTRYMKCPHCGKRSWNKKVISKE